MVSSLLLIQWRVKHHFSKDMEFFMRWSVIRFRVLSLDTESKKALLAIVKIKALIALVSDICNGHCATSITFDCFFNWLAGLHYHLDAVLICVMVASYLKIFVRCCEVAVLAYTKTRATWTNKTGSYNRLHIATDALLIVVGSQAVS